MKRANTFAVRPLTDDDEQVLRELLDASAALWNEINYERLIRYNDEDGFEHPNPPGFRGNDADGRVLKGVIRKDAYTVEWGERSRLEFVVGEELRDKHNSPKSRLRLELVGDPNWPEYEDQGRLELWYDETDGTFRASQPVTVSEQATPLAEESAALDIGANNLVACTTTTGEQYLYEGRELFQRFRDTTREIARLQSKLREGRYSSKRIRRLYR